MAEDRTISGIAAPLPVNNLDTDQIMPKQFLRGIDKDGLDRGLLYDLRFDDTGRPRADFVLNRPEYASCRILVAGENFGCGSSREHAVWGLLQFGIEAIVAPSFGEIFFSNALNNRLLPVVVSQPDVERFLSHVASPATNFMTIDVVRLIVRSRTHEARFALPPRYHRMFIDNLDLIGASLGYKPAIAAFEEHHWVEAPWLKSVASMTCARIKRSRG